MAMHWRLDKVGAVATRWTDCCQYVSVPCIILKLRTPAQKSAPLVVDNSVTLLLLLLLLLM